MERQAKDGTFYKQVGEDEWEPITREAKDGTLYKKVGQDEWEPFETEQPQQKQNAPTKTASALRQFANSGAAGFSDEIAGLLDAYGLYHYGIEGLGSGDILDIKLRDTGPESRIGELKDAYFRGRNKERGLLKQDVEANPEVSGVASVAGAFASPLNKATKGLSLAKAAGAYGVASGVGESEDENLVGLVFDGASNGLVAATLGKAGEKILPPVAGFVGKAAEPFKSGAERLAHKAMGSDKGLVRRIGKDKAREAGRYALDNKILKWFNSADDQLSRNKSLQKQAGNQMDEVYSAVDRNGPTDFVPTQVAKDINKKVGGIYRTPINKDVVSFFDNAIETIQRFGNKPISLKKAQQLKEMIDAPANWGKAKNLALTEKEEIARKVSTELKKQIEDAVESGARELNSKPLMDKFLKAKKDYGNTKNIGKMIDNQIAKEEGNQAGVGLMDLMAAGGGYTYGGDVETALGFALARRGLKSKGSQIGAKFLDTIGKTVNLPSRAMEMIATDPRAAVAFTSMFDDKMLDLTKEVKGLALWQSKGFSKLYKHANGGIFNNPEAFEYLAQNKNAKKLMQEASGLKPGSKRMKAIYKELEGMVDSAASD